MQLNLGNLSKTILNWTDVTAKLIVIAFVANAIWNIGEASCEYCPSIQQQNDCNYTSETGETVLCSCETTKDS